MPKRQRRPRALRKWLRLLKIFPPKLPIEPEPYIGPSAEESERAERRRAEAMNTQNSGVLYQAEEENNDFGGDDEDGEFTSLDEAIKMAAMRSSAESAPVSDEPLDMKEIGKDALLEDVAEIVPDENEDGEEDLPPVELISENSWRILGSASIGEVEDALGIKLEDTDSDTFSGYALGIYGSVPDDGTNFELTTENLNIVIEEIKDHRIDRATVSIKQPEDENDIESKAE